MSYTADELAALKSAYASGLTEVRLADGRTTKYDSGAALLRRIRVIEGEMAAAASAPANRVGFASFTRA